MSLFDQLYKDFVNGWGYEPSALAKRAAKELPEKAVILDIGAGEGRDSIFFASMGHEVEAIESSTHAVETMRKRLKEREGLKVKLIVDDIVGMNLAPDKYDLIFANMSLQFMTRAQRNEVLEILRHSTKKGGLIAITQVTVEEAAWKQLQWNKDYVMGVCTIKFRDDVMNFAQIGEYKKIFAKDHILEYWEGMIDDEGHPGFEQPHTHAIVSVMARIVHKSDTSSDRPLHPHDKNM